MASVCVWLLEHCGEECAAKASGIDLIQDPPSTVAKQLLHLSQMAGVSLKDLSEILPTSLLPGYGEKVCLFLLLLCGVVLKKKNHTWLPLNYKNMIRNEKKSVNSNGNIEYDEWIDQDEESSQVKDIIDERGREEGEEEEDSNSMEGSTTEGVKRSMCVSSSLDANSAADSHHLGYSILLPSMDPVQWREEAERVVSKLKNGVTQNRLAENWGDHLTVLRNYVKENDFIRHDNNRKLSNNDIDQNNMSIDQIKNKKSIVEDNEICIKNENRSAILLSINHLKLTLSNQLGAINRSEKILNSTQKYHILSAEYENNKKAIDNFHTRLTSTVQKIENASNTSSEIEDKLQEVLEALNARTGGMGGGDGDDHGTSAVVKLRTAIKVLKDEIDLITIQSGVLSSVLLTRSAAAAKESLRNFKKKQNLKSTNSKYKNKNNYHPDVNLEPDYDDNDVFC